MEFDPIFFALAVPAVILAGISKGGFGSGIAFLATPILALVVDPGLALGVMLPLLMLVDAVTLRPYWRQWSLPDARLLILGGLPGVALGAALFRIANADHLRFLIGVIAVGFVVYQLITAPRAGPRAPRDLPWSIGLLAGLVTGLTSFISHAGGPPAAMYLLAKGMSKTSYQATTILVFWAVNIFKFVPYAFLGIFTTETVWANVLLAPFALIGAALGVYAHRLVPERVFFTVTYTILACAGTKLIWDALT